MKRPAGWQLLAGVAAALAAVLALRLATGRFRGAAPTRERAVVAPERTPFPPWEGPLMQIDPGDLARAGRERDDNGLEMTFCWCPPGTFRMGNPPPAYLDQDPRDGPVRVTLSRGFWMGKYEVTQGQWQRVMGRSLRQQRSLDPTQPRPLGDGSTRDHAGEGPDYPIYFVGAADAEEFCRKLTEAERAAGRLEPGWTYRLPTEAQWEFACRAGTTTETAFGDRLGSAQANFDGSKPHRDAPAGPYLRDTTPAGRYPANAWGLHDTHGNVSEWCRDGFAPLAGGTDPVEEYAMSRRAYRGGCWYDQGGDCLSATRHGLRAGGRGSGIGLRVALVPTGH